MYKISKIRRFLGFLTTTVFAVFMVLGTSFGAFAVEKNNVPITDCDPNQIWIAYSNSYGSQYGGATGYGNCVDSLTSSNFANCVSTDQGFIYINGIETTNDVVSVSCWVCANVIGSGNQYISGTVGYICSGTESSYSYADVVSAYNSGASALGVTLCPAGKYCEANRQNLCPYGTYSDAGASSESDCYTCPAGYYCATGNKHECPAGWYCPAGSYVETKCPDGTYSNAGASSCYTCPEGYYCSDKITGYGGDPRQMACPAGKWSNAGAQSSSDCSLQCPAGYYCAGDGSKVACPAGTYRSSTGGTSLDSCSSCPAGKYCSIASTSSGTNCPSGTYSDAGAESESDCYACPAGYYCNGTKWGCPAGYYCPAGSSSGSRCPAGTWSDVGAESASDCYACPAGYYCAGYGYKYECSAGGYCPESSSAPIGCPAGTYSDAGAESESDCYACPAGYYCRGNGYSKEDCPDGKYCPAGSSWGNNCPAGTWSDAGASSESDCYACPAGYYCSGNGPNPKYTCPAGRYCPAGSSLAEFCPAGSYCPAGSSAPIGCPVGTSSSAESSSLSDCSLTCPAGKYCDGTGWTVCPDGTWSDAGAESESDCYACPAGYLCMYGEKDTCPAGRYCPAGTSSYGTSSLCPDGTYSDAGASSESDCYTCPAGYYCTGNGYYNSKDTCPAGYYCPAGSSDYTSCPAGSYCPAGSSAPIGCPVGTASNAYSSSLSGCSIACQEGYYCDGAGLTVCPDGTWSDAGAESSNDCYTCPAGYYCRRGYKGQCFGMGAYCPAGSSSRETCPAGYYCSSVGNKYECPAGEYCPAGSSWGSNCPAGTWSDAGASSESDCYTCPAGYYCTGNGYNSKDTCPAGYYCPAGSSSTTACPAGTYRSSTGGTSLDSCYSCPAGKYCSIASTSSGTNCPAGTWSDGGAESESDCDDCPAGNYCNGNGSKYTCPAGNYCPAGSSSYTSCPAGSYCPAGSSAPIACDAGTGSPANSTSASDCVSYNISYTLNGGSLASGVSNPSTYTILTETFTLNNPTKSGYVFVGWCDDANLSQNCAVNKQIAKGSTGDKHFYAVFIEENYPFQVTTTDLSAGDSFSFYISAAGRFLVDCGAGGVLSGAGVVEGSGVIIRGSANTGNTYTCTYETVGGVKTVRLGGRATQYRAGTTPAVRFSYNGHLAGISGSLGAVFPTIGATAQYDPTAGLDPNDVDDVAILDAIQPSFSGTFSGCSGLTGSIPATLFNGVVGQPRKNMFDYTFFDCDELTGTNVPDPNNPGMYYAIPPTLFGGISGVPAQYMFKNTFTSSGLTGSIPATLFSGISGAPAEGMFYITFDSCSGLTGSIPATLFSGISGAPAAHMFDQTFDGCFGLTGSIPPMLFSGIDSDPSKAATDQMLGVFSNTTGLVTSCPIGTTQYTTGFESYFNNRVSCIANNEIICPAGQSLTGSATSCSACSGSGCPTKPTVYTCPAGYASSNNVSCDITFPFTMTTTSLPDNDYFGFRLSAAGVFYVDWGDGVIEKIDRTNNTSQGLYAHKYTTGGVKTVRLGGTATAYAGSYAAIDFNDGGGYLDTSNIGWVGNSGTVYFREKLAGISGSLGAIFPTIGVTAQNPDPTAGLDPETDAATLNAIQPMFRYLFSGATNLTGSIPATLFNGVVGQPRENMFDHTFSDCSGLTGSIPATLFSGISGAPAQYMFQGTFAGCSGLTGSIPATLFSGISGAPAVYMFGSTFYGCSGLTGSIPEDLFGRVINGQYHGIEGTPQYGMFYQTFAECFRLTRTNEPDPNNPGMYHAVPEDLFGRVVNGVYHGVNGSTPQVTINGYTTRGFAFRNTFTGCVSLNGTIPEKLFHRVVNGEYKGAKLDAPEDAGMVFSGCPGLIGSVPQTAFGVGTAASYAISGDYNLGKVCAACENLNDCQNTVCPAGEKAVYEYGSDGWLTYCKSCTDVNDCLNPTVCPTGQKPVSTYYLPPEVIARDYMYGVLRSTGFVTSCPNDKVTYYNNNYYNGGVSCIAPNSIVCPAGQSLTADGNGNYVCTNCSGADCPAVRTVVSCPTGYINNADFSACIQTYTITYANVDMPGVTFSDSVPVQYYYDNNTGSYYYKTGSSSDWIQGSTFTLNSANNPIRSDGSTFLGWCNDAALTSGCSSYKYVWFSDVYNSEQKNPTYYAKWEETYNITYYGLEDSNFESSNPNPSTYTNTHSTYINYQPTKSGYNFVGWCDDAELTLNCDTYRYISSGSSGDKTFYAKWELQQQYCSAGEYAYFYDGGSYCNSCESGYYCPGTNSTGGNVLTPLDNGKYACPALKPNSKREATALSDCTVCPRNDTKEYDELESFGATWYDMNGDGLETIDECVDVLYAAKDMDELQKCAYQMMATDAEIMQEFGAEMYYAYGFDKPCDYNKAGMGLMTCQYNNQYKTYRNCSTMVSGCSDNDLQAMMLAMEGDGTSGLVDAELDRKGLNKNTMNWNNFFVQNGYSGLSYDDIIKYDTCEPEGYKYCDAGKYYSVSASDCVDCPAGSACVGGLYATDSVADAGIEACSGNTFSTAKATSCTACPAGVSTASNDHTTCSCTGNGFTYSVKNNTCEVASCDKTTDYCCDTGEYLVVDTEKGYADCETCPAGSYCEGVVVPIASASGDTGATTCENGYYSAAGATACTACPAGSTSNNDHTGCVCSDTSKYFDIKNGVGSCVTCPAGSLGANADSTACECPTGFEWEYDSCVWEDDKNCPAFDYTVTSSNGSYVYSQRTLNPMNVAYAAAAMNPNADTDAWYHDFDGDKDTVDECIQLMLVTDNMQMAGACMQGSQSCDFVTANVGVSVCKFDSSINDYVCSDVVRACNADEFTQLASVASDIDTLLPFMRTKMGLSSNNDNWYKDGSFFKSTNSLAGQTTLGSGSFNSYNTCCADTASTCNCGTNATWTQNPSTGLYACESNTVVCPTNTTETVTLPAGFVDSSTMESDFLFTYDFGNNGKTVDDCVKPIVEFDQQYKPKSVALCKYSNGTYLDNCTSTVTMCTPEAMALFQGIEDMSELVEGFATLSGVQSPSSLSFNQLGSSFTPAANCPVSCPTKNVANPAGVGGNFLVKDAEYISTLSSCARAYVWTDNNVYKMAVCKYNENANAYNICSDTIFNACTPAQAATLSSANTTTGDVAGYINDTYTTVVGTDVNSITAITSGAACSCESGYTWNATSYSCEFTSCPAVSVAESPYYVLQNGYMDFGGLYPTDFHFVYDFDNNGTSITDCVTMVAKADDLSKIETNPAEANITGVSFCRYDTTTSNYTNCATPVAPCDSGELSTFMTAMGTGGASGAFDVFATLSDKSSPRALTFNKTITSLTSATNCVTCPDVPLASAQSYYLMQNGYMDFGSYTNGYFRFAYDFDDDGKTTGDCVTMVAKADDLSKIETNPAEANITGISFCRYDTTSQGYTNCATPIAPCSNDDLNTFMGAMTNSGPAAAFESFATLSDKLSPSALVFNNTASSLTDASNCLSCPTVPLASAPYYAMANGYMDFGALYPSQFLFAYDFDNNGKTANDCLTMVVQAEHPEYIENNPGAANITGVSFCRYNGSNYTSCATPVAPCDSTDLTTFMTAMGTGGAAAAFDVFTNMSNVQSASNLTFNSTASGLSAATNCSGATVSCSEGYVDNGNGTCVCDTANGFLCCDAGRYVYYDSGKDSYSCEACTAGNYCEGGAWDMSKLSGGEGLSSCPSGSTSTTGSSACTCSSGTWDSTNHECASTAVSCSEGYVDNGNGTCVCDTANGFLCCDAGRYVYYDSGKDSYSCEACTAGNYCEGGAWDMSKLSGGEGLSSCPSGSTSTTGSSACTCSSGTWDSTNHECASTAVSCPNGYTDDGNGGCACDTAKGYVCCSAGEFALYDKSNGTHVCTACNAGNYCEGGAWDVSNSTEDVGITSCPAHSTGSTLDFTACTCESGYTWDSTNHECASTAVSCPEGYIDDGKGGCACDTANGFLCCSAGEFALYDKSNGTHVCTACVVGNYCEGGAWDVSKLSEDVGITSCPNHSTGSTLDFTACTCESGYTWDSTNHECASTAVSCPNGYTDDGNGGCTCDTAKGYVCCSAGEFALYDKSNGTHVCTACAAGNYCEGGAWDVSNSTEDVGITSCPNHSTGSTLDFTACTCESGYTWDSTNHVCACDTANGYLCCNAGQYLVQTPNAEAGYCTQCYQNNDTSCSSCGAGTACSSCYKGDSESCDTCNAYIATLSSGYSCGTCQAGSYCLGGEFDTTGSITDNGMTQCPAHSTGSTLDFTACTCESGYTWDSTNHECVSSSPAFTCESETWLHVGNEQICTYSSVAPNTKALAIRTFKNNQSHVYYVMLTDAKEHDYPIHSGSSTKLKIKEGNVTYNAHDTSVVEN